MECINLRHFRYYFTFENQKTPKNQRSCESQATLNAFILLFAGGTGWKDKVNMGLKWREVETNGRWPVLVFQEKSILVIVFLGTRNCWV